MVFWGDSLWVRVNRLDSITCYMARVKFSIAMSIECLLLVTGIDIAERSEKVLL